MERGKSLAIAIVQHNSQWTKTDCIYLNQMNHTLAIRINIRVVKDREIEPFQQTGLRNIGRPIPNWINFIYVCKSVTNGQLRESLITFFFPFFSILTLSSIYNANNLILATLILYIIRILWLLLSIRLKCKLKLKQHLYLKVRAGVKVIWNMKKAAKYAFISSQ